MVVEETFTESKKLSDEIVQAAEKLKGLDSLIPPELPKSALPPIPPYTSITNHYVTNHPQPQRQATDLWIVLAGIGLSCGFMCAGIALHG